MNQSQVNNFLKCLLHIDDLNYLALHAYTQSSSNNNNNNNNNSNTDFHNAAFSTLDSSARHDDDHDHEHDHEHEHEHSASHDLLVAKVTAMVVLCCASTLCGSVPFLLNRCFKWTENSTNARSATTVKCLLYFGGGVLLCTTFLHLLPEVQEVVEQLQQCGSLPSLSFALPEMLMCAGFFLMYLIEESIHAYIHKHNRLLKSDAGAGAAFERGHSVRNSYLVKSNAGRGGGEARAKSVISSAKSKQHCDHNNSDSVVGLSVQDLISHDLENQKYDNSELNLQQPDNRHLEQHNEYQHGSHHHHNTHAHSHSHAHSHAHAHAHHSHLPAAATGDDGDMITSSLRGLFIVLALSLHELFEGMAIGLEGSASSVWFMFGAVSAHKLVLAFCVGVELIVARTRIMLAIVYVLTFAVVSPIGIGLGILISYNKDGSAPTIPAAILQGLACGTLLYVVFFEILSKNHSGLGTYFALAIGFAVIFGLQQIGADGHGHSHGSCSPTSNNGRGVGDVPQFTHHSHQHPHQNQQNSAWLEHKENSFEQQLQILREASQKVIAQHNQIN